MPATNVLGVDGLEALGWAKVAVAYFSYSSSSFSKGR